MPFPLVPPVIPLSLPFSSSSNGSLNASKLGNPFYHDASDGTLPEEVAVEWFKNNIIEKIKNT